MAYGDLKVRNLIWNTGSGDNTVVLSTLATQSYVTTNFAPKANPTFSGTINGADLILSGNLTVNGTQTIINTQTLDVEDKQIEIGKVSSPSDTTADQGGWKLKGATDKTFLWVNATDAWTSSEHIHLGDNKKLIIGTGSDLQIYHDGSNSYINDTGTGALFLKTNYLAVSGSNGEQILNAQENGAVELYHDNVKKLETTSGGVEVTTLIVPGSTTTKITTNQLQFNRASGYSYIDQLGSGGALAFRTMNGGSETVRMLIEAGGNVNLPDNGHLTFGGSSDLQIRHNGSHGYITTITGNLLLQAANHIQLKPANGEDAIQAVSNGAVELYYDNSKKFETTSGGVNVTGALTVNGAALSSAPTIDLTASGAIAANKPVIVNTSGQAEQVAIPADTVGSGNYQASAATDGVRTFSNGANQYVQIRISGGNIKARTANLAAGGTTISWGTEVQLENASGGWTSFDCTYIAAKSCYMMGYVESNGAHVKCFTIAGNGSITAGTGYHINSVTNTQMSIACDKSSSDGWCSLFYMDETNNRIEIRGFKPNHAGNVLAAPTVGSHHFITGMSGSTTTHVAYNEDSGIFHGIWYKHSGTLKVAAWTLNSSGTPSFKSQTDMVNGIYHDSGYGWMEFGIAYEPNLKKMIICYPMQSGDATRMNTLNYTDAGGWSLGADHSIGTNKHFMNLQYFAGSKTLLLMFMTGTNNTDGKGPLKVMKITVDSSGSFTNGTTTTINSGNYDRGTIATGSAGALIGARDQDSSAYPEGFFFKVGTTNLTAENFIGFASAAISNGATGTINVVGNTINPGVVGGMTTARKYYVLADGSISTTASDLNVEAGIALSSTKLLIKG